MNKGKYINSNNTNINLPHQPTWIRIENRLLRVGITVSFLCRATYTQILSISFEDDFTIKFCAQGHPIYNFDTYSLRLDSSKPYQVN